MPQATVHLISLQPTTNASNFISELNLVSFDSPPYLIKGRPCGWVQRPRTLNKDNLTAHEWDIFLVTKSPTLPAGMVLSLADRVSATIEMPQAQYTALLSVAGQDAQAAGDTPPLPDNWQPDEVQAGRRGSKFYGLIPETEVLGALDREERPGELRLDHPMAWFLSTAEPAGIRGAPVLLFNLFKYRGGDRSTHDEYMQGFKEKFGKAAGAQVRFMGEVGDLNFAVQGAGEGGRGWDEANLTQYDSVWHYAYMLSTDVYKELNKEKILPKSRVFWSVSTRAFPTLVLAPAPTDIDGL
ncbi:hypothetical protein PSPO01_01568 [Paraphaeosphaeria sporulosa]